MNNKTIELLAPAGSFDTFKTAINSGADAVYIGGSMFSARASATNFDNKEIIEAVDYAHIRNVKLYVAINTLIKDNELKDCIDYIKFLYKIGVDSIIVQDIGLTSIIRHIVPDISIHFSTQSTVASIADIEALKEFNIQRIILPREANINEISYICKHTTLEMEAFIHGALCVSYSGKCLFSALNGGRSGNRGSCAQVCRKQYILEVDGEVANDNYSKYILSPKDLKTSSSIDKIIKSGVSSLKIEGRMKRKEYIHVSVSTYRNLIDEYLKNGKISDLSIKEADDNLSKVFNRSFTGGYILNNKGSDIINNTYQKPLGDLIGKVISFNPKQKKLKIKLYEKIQKGDGLNIGENVGRIITKNGKVNSSAEKGDVVYLDYIHNIKKDTLIYRTFDAGYEKKLEEKQKIQKKLPLNAFIQLKVGEKPVLTLNDENITVSSTSDFEILSSIKSPVENNDIIRQLEKTDTFPFTFTQISIEKDNNIFIPVKILNELRRSALEKFCILKKNNFKREDINFNTNQIFEKENYYSYTYSKKIFVQINDEAQIFKLNPFMDNIFSIISSDIEIYKKIFTLYPDKAVYNMPCIIRQEDYNSINSIKNSFNKAKIMFSNYGSLIEDNAYIANYHLNIYNSFSHNYYNSKNVYTVASLENVFVNSDEYNYINDKSKVIIPAYIYPELMLTEFCPHKDNSGRCKYNYNCKLPNTALINEHKDRFLFERFLNCKTSILSDKPYFLEKSKISKYIKQGYSNFLVQFKQEKENDIKNIINEIVNS